MQIPNPLKRPVAITNVYKDNVADLRGEVQGVFCQSQEVYTKLMYYIFLLWIILRLFFFFFNRAANVTTGWD